MIKLSTFEGKTSWQVRSTQFTMLAEANRWRFRDKAFYLAVSLKEDAADILLMLLEVQSMTFKPFSVHLSWGLEKSLRKNTTASS